VIDETSFRGAPSTTHSSGKLGEIRDTVNRGWPLGGERFKDEIERALKCATRSPKRGRSTRAAMPNEHYERPAMPEGS
jgi:hypothetical protein